VVKSKRKSSTEIINEMNKRNEYLEKLNKIREKRENELKK